MKRRPWASARRSAFDIAGPGLFRHRMRVAAPLIVQCALLAGAAWWIAQSLFDHRTPVFAATAALICLTVGKGGRGRQAVDLLVGVLAHTACGHAREAHARLGELSRARAAAQRVTGRTVRVWRRAARLRQADQPLDDVELLIAAVLLLCEDVRAGLARSAPTPDPLPSRLTALADGPTAPPAHPTAPP
ncbi:hypothetical protein [Micromonospora sp. DT47]|uniref:hypothetical protein n=1 Tax=Micromonospora sp. DT47 TaxID=3393431 RepID=UPI003CE9FCEA